MRLAHQMILRGAVFTLALWAGVAGAADGAAQDCGPFKWDLTHERALFAGTPTTLIASAGGAITPPLQVDQFYQLTLVPQGQVNFAAPLGKRALSDGAFGGTVPLHVPTSARYRIAVDQPFWIDVVANGQLVPSSDFGGRAGCAPPHKIVIYVLPAGDLTLQLSGATSPSVHLSITRADPAPSP